MRQKVFTFTFTFTITLILVLIIPTVISAHFKGSGSNSVDNGEIRWGTAKGTTVYTTARNNAISKWDALGTINIASDTPYVIEDLSFRDYYEDDGYLGWWRQRSGADIIEFNDVRFQNLSPCQRNHTALHEMGHALNLAHNTESGSVMRTGALCQSSLGDHDERDYYMYWGY